MIRRARSLFVLLFSVALIAAGAESKKKSGTAGSRTPTPKPAAASKQTPRAAASSPKPSSKSPSKKRSQKPATDDDESPTPDSSAKASTKSDAQGPEATSSRRNSSKAKASPVPSEPESTESTPTEGPLGMQGPEVATIAPDALRELNQQPEWVRQLIHDALNLSAQNLGYLFGSADPQSGGMDCSGTIYYILQKHGYNDVPRDSRGQYAWLAEKGTLRTVSDEEMAGFDFRALRPGDLLFWTGTHQVNGGMPISHVMLYLGIEKATGKPVMWGASDGRSYAGKQRFGVSVFDFKLPRTESKSRFVGFGQLLPAPRKR